MVDGIEKKTSVAEGNILHDIKGETMIPGFRANGIISISSTTDIETNWKLRKLFVQQKFLGLLSSIPKGGGGVTKF